jgi:NAD(P)-dependent dehydrogenase (short-subunit alcohol dehydrogenase family)
MTQKIALITGAGSGVGRAVSMALAEASWHLALVGRTQATLEETAKLCPSAKVKVYPTDISKPEEVSELYQQLVRDFGRLDLLFNNAGVNAPAMPMEELPFEEWKRVIDINLTGSYLCAREAVKLMKNQRPIGGRIINNGSISSHIPRPQAVPYNASKHAITGLTKSIMLDGRAFNIACGQIDIGNAGTDMTKRMQTGVIQADGSLKPEPIMQLEDVGRAVVYMASLPTDTNIPWLTIMANEMPYAGRG